jgi:hypothetical protein
VHAQIGNALARGEFEIVDDEVAFNGRGKLSAMGTR